MDVILTPKPSIVAPQVSGHAIYFLFEISQNVNFKQIIDLLLLSTIPMTLLEDKMPYFNEQVNAVDFHCALINSEL